MFRLTLAPGARIEVAAAKHRYSYATDGSAPNPLESTYAAFAGCAGVYAKKACRELGIADEGIDIAVRVAANASRPLMPERMVTTVAFPERFTPEQRAAVLASIEKCAVKALVQNGAAIGFVVEEGAVG